MSVPYILLEYVALSMKELGAHFVASSRLPISGTGTANRGCDQKRRAREIIIKLSVLYV